MVSENQHNHTSAGDCNFPSSLSPDEIKFLKAYRQKDWNTLGDVLGDRVKEVVQNYGEPTKTEPQPTPEAADDDNPFFALAVSVVMSLILDFDIGRDLNEWGESGHFPVTTIIRSIQETLLKNFTIYDRIDPTDIINLLNRQYQTLGDHYRLEKHVVSK